MLVALTAVVSCGPEALDPLTDPDRVVFCCKDESSEFVKFAPDIHVTCAGILSKRVLSSIQPNDRIMLVGAAELMRTELGGDVSAGWLAVEAIDLRVVTPIEGPGTRLG